MKNLIQFRNKFVNLPNTNGNNYQLAMSVTSELLQFGFLLDKSAIDNLTNSDEKSIVSFHNEVITWLKDITGSNRNYRPFHKNFPTDVMNMTECELYLHQILHYISNGSYEPTEWAKARPTAFEQPKYTIITSGDENKFLNIFKSLVSGNQSLIPDDLEMVRWFVSSGTELKFPESIPFKETLTMVLTEVQK